MKFKCKILIADDHTIFRAGLRALLSADPDWEVVGEADDGRGVVRLVVELSPDLVIMDLSMPGVSGMEAIAHVRKRSPETRILVLTIHKTEEHIRAALHAGANGYVLKDASSAELMMAIKCVVCGKTFLSPSISDKVVTIFLDRGSAMSEKSHWDTLTMREREILKLIAEANSNKHIANYLCLSIKTVEKHRSNLMKKLDLHNVSALTTFAIGKGLVATS
jgi:two-component system, NarL family, response regulator NreC